MVVCKTGENAIPEHFLPSMTRSTKYPASKVPVILLLLGSTFEPIAGSFPPFDGVVFAVLLGEVVVVIAFVVSFVLKDL